MAKVIGSKSILNLSISILVANLVVCQQGLAIQQPSESEVAVIVNKVFGPTVKLRPGDHAFVIGDFNGDGVPDLAVLLDLGQTRELISRPDMSFLNIHPGSKDNGNKLGHDDFIWQPEALGILHGSVKGDWTSTEPKYLFFTAGHALTVAHQIPSKPGAYDHSQETKKGENLFLALSKFSTLEIYWDGSTYHSLYFNRQVAR